MLFNNLVSSGVAKDTGMMHLPSPIAGIERRS